MVALVAMVGHRSGRVVKFALLHRALADTVIGVTETPLSVTLVFVDLDFKLPSIHFQVDHHLHSFRIPDPGTG